MTVLGEDETSVVLLTLQFSGDAIVGTIDQTGDDESNGAPSAESAPVTGRVTGHTVTLSIGPQVSSSGTLDGDRLVLGVSDHQQGYHLVTFTPASPADYQTAVARHSWTR